MVSLEQIRQLESKVHGAVARIKGLVTENTTLKGRLSQYEKRITELEELISAFKTDQDEIEQGIVAALSQLDTLEDAVADQTAPASSHARTGPSPPPPEGNGNASDAEDSDPIETGPEESPSNGADAPEDDGNRADDPDGQAEPGEEEQELDIF